MATAFVGGATLMRLVQGVLFGYVLGSSGEGDGRISSLLLLLMGILLWITAIKKWRKEDDPDGPPPKWMSSIDGMSPLRAFRSGCATGGCRPEDVGLHSVGHQPCARCRPGTRYGRSCLPSLYSRRRHHLAHP